MAEFDAAKAEALELKYDTSLQTRAIGPILYKFVFAFSIFFAAYHYITAGTGVPVDYWHMGTHMSGVILLVFIGFPAVRGQQTTELSANNWWRYANVPIWDWLFIIAGVSSAYYVGITWYEIDFEIFGFEFQLPEQVLRQGNPAQIDVVLGTILIIVLLEAVRRTLGPIVPCIIIAFIMYAVFGMQMPFQILKHPGVNWNLFINTMYFPEEGIFGVTLWIVSTVVFHFVLFGGFGRKKVGICKHLICQLPVSNYTSCSRHD